MLDGFAVVRQDAQPGSAASALILGEHAVERCTYLLPIRRSAFSEAEARALAQYFRQLRVAACDVLVIDGSDPEIFDLHSAIWSPVCRHYPVDARFRYLNGKVNGILTGVELATHERIVLADDDVRYTGAQVAAICRRLDTFDVVRPQNFFGPLPWCARIEGARMLINRALLRSGDYPGTCAFRRSAMQRTGEYDGDVLFDNEEIIRHFARCGLKIDYAIDFFVRKVPPTTRKWIEQRPRQAYEDFPLRAKTVAFAAVLPTMIIAGFDVGAFVLFLAVLAMASVVLAYAGWRRGMARRWFPASVCFCAPLWIFERSISTYVAIGWYVSRGGYPFGGRVVAKGVGRDWFVGRRLRGFRRFVEEYFAESRGAAWWRSNFHLWMIAMRSSHNRHRSSHDELGDEATLTHNNCISRHSCSPSSLSAKFPERRNFEPERNEC